jgi:hypothetical protein
MKKQDVIALINALAPIKIVKVEKDLRCKILKNNFELQKVSKELSDFVEQSKQSLFADMQEDFEKVANIRATAGNDRAKIIQAELKVKKEFPKVIEQEAVLNDAYRKLLEQDIELDLDVFTEDDIISMYQASEIDLTLADLNYLNTLLTIKN